MTTASITITRDDNDITVDIVGTVHKAERDLGLMSDWGEVQIAKDSAGVDVELTAAEMTRAEEALVEAASYDGREYEYQDRETDR